MHNHSTPTSLAKAKEKINEQGHKLLLLNEHTMTGELEPDDLTESDHRGRTPGFYDGSCWVMEGDKSIWAIPADLESPLEAGEFSLLMDYDIT